MVTGYETIDLSLKRPKANLLKGSLSVQQMTGEKDRKMKRKEEEEEEEEGARGGGGGEKKTITKLKALRLQ